MTDIFSVSDIYSANVTHMFNNTTKSYVCFWWFVFIWNKIFSMMFHRKLSKTKGAWPTNPFYLAVKLNESTNSILDSCGDNFFYRSQIKKTDWSRETLAQTFTFHNIEMYDRILSHLNNITKRKKRRDTMNAHLTNWHYFSFQVYWATFILFSLFPSSSFFCCYTSTLLWIYIFRWLPFH